MGIVGTLSAVDARAATIAVAAGGNLQAAINAAQPGDTITLAAGATYVGNFTLPNKGALTQAITIRSAAADSLLPAAGVRMSPSYAAYLPKIKSGNSMSALTTAPAANHWTLMFLEFQANTQGYGDIIELGAGDSSQTSLSQVPYSLVLDRVYVHGDPAFGQKRGIALNSRDTNIINSYIADCKAVGDEAQAIQGFNGPGNYLIENNYLEGSTQSILFGGADPPIQNLVTSNITFRRNYLSKPLAWRNPFVATPAGVHAVAGKGSLAAGTYGYMVVAQAAADQGNVAQSSPSAEVLAAVSAGGAVTISWTAVPGASGYVVYGRTPGGENMYWTTATSSFTDTGSTGTAGTPGSGTVWYVKNLFELKNAQDVLVEGNVMEDLWIAAQSGYSILFTPRNQGGYTPWAVVQRVTFQYNLVRHISGGINILGYDDNPSQQANHITIRENLFQDMGSAWGAGSRPFLVGASPDSVTIDHNTILTDDSAIVYLYGGSETAPAPITNFVYTNNMSAHNDYGIDGSSFAPGWSSINAYLPNPSILANVLAGGPASQYPAGNFFPATTDWQANFVNYAAADYHLVAGSPYKNAGTDNTDLGANIDAITAQTAITLSGNDTGGGAVAPSKPTNVHLKSGM
jgi:hypothetical protein